MVPHAHDRNPAAFSITHLLDGRVVFYGHQAICRIQRNQRPSPLCGLSALVQVLYGAQDFNLYYILRCPGNVVLRGTPYALPRGIDSCLSPNRSRHGTVFRSRIRPAQCSPTSREALPKQVAYGFCNILHGRFDYFDVRAFAISESSICAHSHALVLPPLVLSAKEAYSSAVLNSA